MGRRRFGSYLVAEGLVSPGELDKALEVQRMLRATTLDDMLTQLGLLSPDAVERWRARHLEIIEDADNYTRVSFESFLVEEQVVSSQDIAQARFALGELHRQRVGEVLVRSGSMTRRELDDVVSRRLGDMHLSL